MLEHHITLELSSVTSCAIYHLHVSLGAGGSGRENELTARSFSLHLDLSDRRWADRAEPWLGCHSDHSCLSAPSPPRRPTRHVPHTCQASHVSLRANVSLGTGPKGAGATAGPPAPFAAVPLLLVPREAASAHVGAVRHDRCDDPVTFVPAGT